MKNKTITVCAALLSYLLLSVPQAALADGHNQLKDAGFEDQLSGDDGGWVLFDESFIASSEKRNGSKSMFNGGFSRTVAYPPFFVGVVSGSYQELPADPGSQWRLTGYGMTRTVLEGAPAFGIVQVSFFDADGKDLGTLETAESDGPKAKTSNEVNNKTPADEWVLLDTGIATAPEGTAAIQAFTLYVDYSGSNLSQGVFFDDLVLCAVDDDDDGSACEGDMKDAGEDAD